MVGDFEARFARVSALLAGADTAFLLVTSPEEAVLQEAVEFQAALERMQIVLKGVLVNRVQEQEQTSRARPRSKKQTDAQVRRLWPQASAEEVRWLAENFLAYEEQARHEIGRAYV